MLFYLKQTIIHRSLFDFTEPGVWEHAQFRVVRVETQQEAQQDGQICQLMLNMSNLIYNNQCRSVHGNNGETTQGCYIFGAILKPDEVS